MNLKSYYEILWAYPPDHLYSLAPTHFALYPLARLSLLVPDIHGRETSSPPPPAIANGNSHFQGLPLPHFFCKTFPKQTSQLAH